MEAAPVLPVGDLGLTFGKRFRSSVSNRRHGARPIVAGIEQGNRRHVWDMGTAIENDAISTAARNERSAAPSALSAIGTSPSLALQ